MKIYKDKKYKYKSSAEHYVCIFKEDYDVCFKNKSMEMLQAKVLWSVGIAQKNYDTTLRFIQTTITNLRLVDENLI